MTTVRPGWPGVAEMRELRQPALLGVGTTRPSRRRRETARRLPTAW